MTYHATDNDKIISPDFNVIYAGKISNDPGWFNIQHSHEFCELFYVTEGKGTIKLTGQSIPICAGDVIIINPWVLHEEHSDPEGSLDFIFIAVKDFEIQGTIPSHIGEWLTPPVFHDCDQTLSFYFRQVLYEFLSQSSFCRQMINGLMLSIVVNLLRLLNLMNQDRQGINLLCARIKEYIDRSFTSDVTLEDLSRHFFISKHYLSHVFRDHNGVSPIKYLISKRMQLAAGLLADTCHSITDISRMSGYDNPLYFSKVFKKTFAMSQS